MSRWGLYGVVGLLVGELAGATPPQPRFREALPSRTVEAPLVLPRGWVRLELGYGIQRARGVWSGSEAPSRVTELQAEWRWKTWRIGAVAGVAHGVALWGETSVQGVSTNDSRIGDLRWGDGRVGVRVGAWQQDVPTTSGVFDLSMAFPRPDGDLDGVEIGRSGGEVAAVGTSTITLEPRVAARGKVGPIRATLDLRAMARLPGKASYLPGGEVELRSIDPGDEVSVGLEILVQAGPLWGFVEPRWKVRQRTTGTVGPGEEVIVAGSGGMEWSSAGGIGLDISRGVRLESGWGRVLFATEGGWFPVLDLQSVVGSRWDISLVVML